jgi:Flp pilus assembly protein TadG
MREGFRRGRGEQGATLVIVAICLIVIMAMLVLTVDLGALFLRQRQMVSGADAAALAAAQTCANSNDTSSPETQADTYAQDNVPGLNGAASGNGITYESPTCQKGGVGRVDVSYTISQDLFFAPAIGMGNSREVKATATAAWGPTGAGNTVPIVLDNGLLQSQCQIPNGVNTGDQCNLWYNNNAGGLGNANWGFMNLSEVVPAATAPQNYNCSSNGGSNSLQNWIINNFGTPIVLNGNPPGTDPTYVCGMTGQQNVNWFSALQTRQQNNPIVLFPVNDCNGQLDKSGNPVSCGSLTAPDFYDVIGFVSLKLIAVYKGNDPAAVGTQGASGTCSLSNHNFAPGDTLDLNNVLQGQPNASNGCSTSPSPDTITNVQITGSGNKTYTQCPTGVTTGCDYQYDNSTHMITWESAAVTGVKITFDWAFNGTSGACSPHTSDANAVCLVTEWIGFSTSSGPIGGGKNFGVSAIELCDVTYKTCPKGT